MQDYEKKKSGYVSKPPKLQLQKSDERFHLAFIAIIKVPI